MKLLLGLIIVVFVFYFGSLRWSREAESVAEVDGKYITYTEYRRELQNALDMYRQTFGGNIPEEMMKSLNIKERVLDGLINQAVLLNIAERMDINTSDEEVQRHISTYPAFQRNGVFDERLYQQALKHNRISPEDFEASQRKGLRIVKLERLIREGAKASDQEAYEAYRIQNEKINLDVYKLPVRNCRKEVRPTEKDLEAYLTENAESLRVPEQVQVRYLAFLAEDYTGKVQVSAEEVKAHYERLKENVARSRGSAPPLSQVQDKIALELRMARAMTAAADAAKKAHDVIYQEENFDEYARKNGLRVHTTGFFAGGNLPAEFRPVKNAAEEIFALKDKDISPVLSGPRGHYLVKLDARKPSYVPGLSEARARIEEKYTEDRARALCQKTAREVLEQARKGEDIRPLARAKGMEVSETGLFPITAGAVPRVGTSKEIAEALLPLSEKNPYVDQVFFADGNFVILKYKGRTGLDPKGFESRKAELRERLQQMKQEGYYQAWLNEQKERMKKEGKITIKKDAGSL
jgi:peptidyl-prolyl cis-trans isomerase D